MDQNVSIWGKWFKEVLTDLLNANQKKCKIALQENLSSLIKAEDWLENLQFSKVVKKSTQVTVSMQIVRK